MLDNTANQQFKLIKKWVEINDESWRTYNEDNQIRLKTSMRRSSLYFYSDSCILVKGTTAVKNKAAEDEANDC